ncbi:MAG: hypothetical protein Q7S50_02105, partial [bacterium]|nr:hypothetical protein [bacterium]
SGGGIVNPAGTTVTIPAGSANVVVTLTPVDDAAVETGGETAILALSAGTGYTVGTPSTATVTIADNDASTSGVPPAVSSITPTSGPVDTTVAITGSGFTTTGNTVHFGVGGKLNVSSSLNGTSISYTIPSSVSICDLIGSTCRAAMMLVNPGAYSISVSNVNGESNTKTFTVGGTTVVVPPSISSINAPTTLKVGETGTWRVTVTSPPGNLNYSVVWGDGTPNAAAAAVAPQSSATTFTHSYASAGSYTPIFRVSNSGGFAQTTASVVVGPIVTITAPDNIATEASLTKGKYTIRRTGPITQLLRVTVTITGTADRGTDYALSGSGMSTGLTAIIPADSATTDIILTPKKDIVDELTQTAIITLDDSPDNPNYSLGTPRSATVRITDNDVQADASAIDEGTRTNLASALTALESALQALIALLGQVQ